MSTDRSAYRSPLLVASAAEGPLRLLVQQYLPDARRINPEGSGEGAMGATRAAIAAGVSAISEAVFAYEGVHLVVDGLERNQDRWNIYLFRPSTRIKEKHLVDAAICELALQQAGLTVGDVHLLLLNSAYVRQGPLDPQGLFEPVRVTRKLRYVQAQVPGRFRELRGMAAKARKKQESRGHSERPAFRLPEPRKAAEGPLPPALPVQVDQAALRVFLNDLQYPLYFMDFEAYQAAIPEYDGHWPFRQLPFQFSVHRLDEPGGVLHQEGFIAPGDAEPVAAFGAALLQVVGHRGSVIVYNRDSEQLILDQLEKDHPEWSTQIEGLRLRLVDLQQPFSQQIVRIPDIGNKLSLKYVLPALVPEMSYAVMVIGSGEEAHKAYSAIRNSTDEALISSVRAALLDYCALDTLAMVKILDKLQILA